MFVEKLVRRVKAAASLARRGRGRLGTRGEALAEERLAAAGVRVVDRNYRCPLGEIDLIARDGPAWVFVEVKTRRDAEVDPLDAVDRHKRRQIINTAVHFCRRFEELPPMRFDVVAINWPRGSPPIVRHVRAAFTADDL